MADQEPIIKIHTEVDQKPLDKGLKEINDKVKKSSDEGSAAFKGMFAALELSSLVEKGLETVKDFLKESVEKAEKSELRLKTFENTLENIGKGGQIQGLLDDAGKLASAYTVTKGEVIDSMQQLELYGGLTQDQIKQLEPVIINFAAKTGSSMEEATTQIVKGLSGQGRELKRFGVEVNASKTTTENFTTIIDNLGQKVKGADEIFSKTSAGLSKNYNKAIGGLQVTIGQELLPVIDAMKENLIKTIQTIKDGVKWVKEHKEVMYALGGAIATVAASLLTYNIYLKSAAILQVAQNVLTFAATIATEGLTVALEEAGIAGQVAWGAITGGLALVVAGLIYAYKTSDKFRAVLAGVGAAAKEVGGIFKGLGELIAGIFLVDPTMIKEGINTLKEAGKDMGDAYSKAYEKSMVESRKKEEKEKEKTADKNFKQTNERDDKLLKERAKKAKEAAKKAEEEIKKNDEKALKALEAHLDNELELTKENSQDRLDQEKYNNERIISFYEGIGKSGKKIYEELGLSADEWALKKFKLTKKFKEDEDSYYDHLDTKMTEYADRLKEKYDKEKKLKEDNLTTTDKLNVEELELKKQQLSKEGILTNEFLEQIKEAKYKQLTDQYNIDINQENLTAQQKLNIKRQYNIDAAKIAEEETNDEKTQMEKRFALAKSYTAAVGDLANTLLTLTSQNAKKGSEEQKKAAKREFVVKKGLGIVNASISTAEAVMKMMTAGPIAGQILAGITAAIGVAQIATIAAKKFNPDSEGGGSSAVSTPTMPSAAQTMNIGTTPTVPKLYNQGGTEYQKVYVTQTDIAKTNNKVNVIQNRATIR